MPTTSPLPTAQLAEGFQLLLLEEGTGSNLLSENNDNLLGER